MTTSHCQQKVMPITTLYQRRLIFKIGCLSVWFNVPFCSIWLTGHGRQGVGTQTQGPKTADEIQCAHVSYITTQKGYTYSTKLHELHKLET
jgi:hypothetical protein